MPKTPRRQQVPLRDDALHVRDPEVHAGGHKDCRSMGERRYWTRRNFFRIIVLIIDKLMMIVLDKSQQTTDAGRQMNVTV